MVEFVPGLGPRSSGTGGPPLAAKKEKRKEMEHEKSLAQAKRRVRRTPNQGLSF
jgi:hypothetical protein